MKPAESAGSDTPEPLLSPPSEQPPSLPELLVGLIEALHAQAQAIDRLAASNEALVDAMGQGEDEAEGDGSPHLGATGDLSQWPHVVGSSTL